MTLLLYLRDPVSLIKPLSLMKQDLQTPRTTHSLSHQMSHLYLLLQTLQVLLSLPHQSQKPFNLQTPWTTCSLSDQMSSHLYCIYYSRLYGSFSPSPGLESSQSISLSPPRVTGSFCDKIMIIAFSIVNLRPISLPPSFGIRGPG